MTQGTMRWVMSTVLTVLVVGCASGPRVGKTAYQPRERNGDGYGYAETQINGRVFEVYFCGVTESDAHQGALRRAADVTLQSGFSAFVILSGGAQAETRVKSRFVVGRVRRNVPVDVITIKMLMRSEFDEAGSIVYDAYLLRSQR